ncbi:hypothetical protein ACFOEE_18300 [Pseudoalteromonas fenneropenaei]|uniref:Uncharacterized protein n=1 Tax=Pseudoalteromonas fenneropenaei TaxID=1737459 RepID=A0ABV7CPL8_9GAMM
MISEQQLITLGFKFGKNGAHAARSMMNEELKLLFSVHGANATKEQYEHAIVDGNILHKPTTNSRKLTYRHLLDLYSLDSSVVIFRQFRGYWALDEKAQDVLALQLAIARDPLLRASSEVILGLDLGERLTRESMEAFLAKDDPTRFSPASLKSFAQNINGTWTQAGYLVGRSKKLRDEPRLSYVNVAFALYLAHCHGLSGQRMFDSYWCKLLSDNKQVLLDLAHRASLHGLIRFKQVSEIIEVTFPQEQRQQGN